MKNNNSLRIKMEFEEQPLIDTIGNIKRPEDFDNMIRDIRLKLFGRKQ